MKILVTGASGYLGSQLTNELANEYEVIALVRSSSSKKRLVESNAVIMIADGCDDIQAILEEYRPDAVINTVALYGRNGESCSQLLNANTKYPLELLSLASKVGVKVFIHTGTSLPDDLSSYALTKNTFVKLARFESLGDMAFINVALEHFYGPNDESSKFLSYVVEQCQSDLPLNMTEGSQRRDFIYIEDVVSAYRVLLEQYNKLAQFDTVSLGSGQAPTLRSVVERVHKIIESNSELNFGALAMRENELMYSCADTSKLHQLGWMPKNSLIEGIVKVLGRNEK